MPSPSREDGLVSPPLAALWPGCLLPSMTRKSPISPITLRGFAETRGYYTSRFSNAYEKKPGPARGPVSVCRRGGRQHLPEGTCCALGTLGGVHVRCTASQDYARHSLVQQRRAPHDRHAKSQIRCPHSGILEFLASENLKMPALRVGNQKVAKYLNARDRLEFLRIDEIGVERERIGFAEQLYQSAVFLHQIVRQHRYA